MAPAKTPAAEVAATHVSTGEAAAHVTASAEVGTASTTMPVCRPAHRRALR